MCAGDFEIQRNPEIGFFCGTVKGDMPMQSAKTKLKALALNLGADLVGVTSWEMLADGPPSADPRYLLPSANSVISFAVSLDSDLAKDFIGK